MDNLTFNNDNYNSTPRFASVNSDANKSKMVEFLIKKGIVKDEKTGNIVLTIFAVMLFIISGYIMKQTLFPSIPEIELSPEEQQIQDQINNLTNVNTE